MNTINDEAEEIIMEQNYILEQIQERDMEHSPEPEEMFEKLELPELR